MAWRWITTKDQLKHTLVEADVHKYQKPNRCMYQWEILSCESSCSMLVCLVLLVSNHFNVLRTMLLFPRTTGPLYGFRFFVLEKKSYWSRPYDVKFPPGSKCVYLHIGRLCCKDKLWYPPKLTLVYLEATNVTEVSYLDDWKLAIYSN